MSREDKVKSRSTVVSILAKDKEITALRTSQAHLAAILEIAHEAIISIDEHQRITLFNRGAEKIFGYTAAEATGQPLNILLPKGCLNATKTMWPTSANRRTAPGLWANGKKL